MLLQSSLLLCFCTNNPLYHQHLRLLLVLLITCLQALAFVYDKEIVANLFDAAPERYGERNGGYTRVKAEPYLRRGDATEMAIIELV
jgi:hypothetical protein